MPETPGPPYRLVYPEKQRRLIRDYGLRAARRGIGPAYLAAIRSIDSHLKTDPITWGDPQNTLSEMGLTLFHGMQSPMHVFYAVDERRRIVYVQSVKPLPHRGLDDEP